MNPITLIAELLAYGMDIDYRDGILYFTGDYNKLPPSLQQDLADHQRAITALVSQDRTGRLDVLGN